MTIEERMDKLERNYRRLLFAGGGLVAVLGVALLLAAPSEDIKDEIRAHSFVVVDKHLKVRAKLWAGKSSPSLILYDEKERPGIMLGMDKHGEDWEFKLFDKNERIRFWADTTDFVIYNKNGGASIGFTSRFGQKGKPGANLTLFDDNGKPIWSAP